jgi:hypothetical protein
MAKYVENGYDSLVDILECIKNFTRRLKIYTGIQLTPAFTETIIEIMAEIFLTLFSRPKKCAKGK